MGPGRVAAQRPERPCPGWQIALLAVGAAIVAPFIAVLLDRARAARRQQLSTDAR